MRNPVAAALRLIGWGWILVRHDALMPREIPPLVPETPDDVRRHREAEIRRSHRLARKAEIGAGRRA